MHYKGCYAPIWVTNWMGDHSAISSPWPFLQLHWRTQQPVGRSGEFCVTAGPVTGIFGTRLWSYEGRGPEVFAILEKLCILWLRIVLRILSDAGDAFVTAMWHHAR